MALLSSRSQIDFFFKILTLSVLFSAIFSLYIFRNYLKPLNGIYFLIFIIVFLVFIIFFNEILQRNWLQKKISPHKKAILITGCDRGFGYGFAETLSEAGFQVFAGCLHPFQKESAKLTSHPHIHRFRMDVTKFEEIQFAMDYVTKNLQNNELWAIVNNAGISKGSDIEATSIEKISEVLDVNLMGTIRVTKVFLPLLQKSKGRVINIASAAGRLLLPGFLPYSISKNAVIAFSDGLRLEMRKYDVHVISVEPWIYRTKLSDVSSITREIDNEWKSESNESSFPKQDHVTLLRKTTANLFSWGVSSDLQEVYQVVEDAVTVQYPRYRYSPGKWYLNAMMWLLHFVPRPVADFLFCNFIFKR